MLRQVVDGQVQKVLRYLVVEDGLQQEHIALLWELTEKVCLVSFALGPASSVDAAECSCHLYVHVWVSNLEGLSSRNRLFQKP